MNKIITFILSVILFSFLVGAVIQSWDNPYQDAFPINLTGAISQAQVKYIDVGYMNVSLFSTTFSSNKSVILSDYYNGDMLAVSFDLVSASFTKNISYGWNFSQAVADPLENYGRQGLVYEQSFPNSSMPGISGDSWYFNGIVNDPINLTKDSSPLQNVTNFTINLWFFINTSNSQYFVEIQGGSGGSSYMRVNGGQYSIALRHLGGTYSLQTATTPLYVGVDGWNMFTMVHDGTDMHLYVNGSLDSSVAAPNPIYSNGGMIFGGSTFFADRNVQGRLDEIYIWNYSLNATQIAGLWNGGSGSFYNVDDVGLVNTYTFNNSLINANLNNGCTCTNCTPLGSQCRMPVLFNFLEGGFVTIETANLTGEFSVDNCSSYPTKAINISFFDQNDAVTDVEYATTATYWVDEDMKASYSNTSPSITETQFCIYPSYANITSNIEIEYTKDSTTFNYFTPEISLNNISEDIDLKTQNGTTEVLFTVQDLDTVPVENAFIHILKYDVGSGAYTTTEILRTDSQGQAIGNIVLTSTFYNFLIYYNGVLVYTEQGVKLITTTRTFNVNLAGADWWDNFETTLGVNTDLYFNDATNNFVFTWSDPASLMHYACLRVDLVNDTGKYNLSNNCVFSTSGTILYNVPSLQNGTEYIGSGYLKFDDPILVERVSKVIAAVRDLFALDPDYSLFIAFIFCLLMLMIGVPNPALAVTLLSVGILFSSILGLYQIAAVNVGSIIALTAFQLYWAGRQTK